MGAFSVDVRVTKPGRRPRWKAFRRVLVDTGSEMTWLPEPGLRAAGVEVFKRDQLFVMANGQEVTRQVGFAIILVNGIHTTDEVVFALEGDMQILGARTLEGLNLTIHPRKKILAPAGPRLAALAF